MKWFLVHRPLHKKGQKLLEGLKWKRYKNCNKSKEESYDNSKLKKELKIKDRIYK